MRGLACFAVLFAATLVCAWPDPPCKRPPEATGFKIENLYGRWYEIGKIQTAGGAIFEKACRCTQLVYYETTAPNATVDNVCRYNSPEGKLTAINATLVGDTSRPGHFLQSFPFGPAGDYNLIYLSEDYAMEYDCTEQLGVTNYCVHIMSRNRTMPVDVEMQLLAYANVTLGLNPASLPYVRTLQAGCPDPE